MDSPGPGIGDEVRILLAGLSMPKAKEVNGSVTVWIILEIVVQNKSRLFVPSQREIRVRQMHIAEATLAAATALICSQSSRE